MASDLARARQELELARAMSQQLWAEYHAYLETLDPARGIAGAEEMRRLNEASQWTRKLYAAEHALFLAEHGTPGIVGSHGQYQWLTMVDRDITSLLGLCPEFVLDKYIAVTRIDGGSLRLTHQEKTKVGGRRTMQRCFKALPGVLRHTATIGKWHIVPASPRFMDCRTRHTTNAVAPMTSGMFSSNRHPEKSERS